jgi:hypothetical protein
MSKKVLLSIIGIILVAGAIGFFIYLKLSANSSTTGDSLFKSFFPFGSSSGKSGEQGGATGTETGENSTEEGGVAEAELPKEYLKHLTSFGIAGGVAFIDTRPSKQLDPVTGEPVKENVSAIRYVESSNGHVHQIFLDTWDRAEISTSTIPAIYEAVFDGLGKSIVYRYLDATGTKIQSFLGILGAPSGQYLPENITAIASSPNSTGYFYITKDGTNGITGTVFYPVGSKTTKIFSSSFTEWNADWVGATNVHLTTKPSWDTEGSLYSLNTNTGIFSKVLGNIRGLTTKVNQDGTHILYSKTTSSGPELLIYNSQKGTTRNLNLNTFGDKCVFAYNTIDAFCAVPNNTMSEQNPDLWYQGVESYTDSIYKINTNTGVPILVTNTEGKGDIDAENLFLDKAENFLFFTNRKDSTLWSLELTK